MLLTRTEYQDEINLASIWVEGPCTVEISYLPSPIHSEYLNIVSGFVSMWFDDKNRIMVVNKNFVTGIETRSEINRRPPDERSPLAMLTIGRTTGKSIVRTSDDREVEGVLVEIGDDFVTIYKRDGSKLMIRKDLVKEIETNEQ